MNNCVFNELDEIANLQIQMITQMRNDFKICFYSRNIIISI